MNVGYVNHSTLHSRYTARFLAHFFLEVEERLSLLGTCGENHESNSISGDFKRTIFVNSYSNEGGRDTSIHELNKDNRFSCYNNAKALYRHCK